MGSGTKGIKLIFSAFNELNFIQVIIIAQRLFLPFKKNYYLFFALLCLLILIKLCIF